MYPAPPSDVIAKLIGRSVEMISFVKYGVHLSLDNEDNIGIACPFRFDRQDAIAESPVQDFPLVSSTMIRVIGASVDQAACEADGTLEVRFDNGDCLIAYANDPSYEAYTLSIDGIEYIV